MDKDTLQAKIEALGPWHYCFSLPHGLTTGTSTPDVLPYKIPGMLKGGAWSKKQYSHALDIGANSGYISMWAVKQFDIHYLDALEGGEKFYEQLRFMLNIRSYPEIHPVHGDIRSIDLPNDFYDLVMMLGVAHHIGEKNLPAVFAKVHKAMIHYGEIIVQTKSDIDIPKYLTDAGFSDIKVVHALPNENRTAWVAFADKMKVSLVEDITCAPQQKSEPKLTDEEKILKALGYENDIKFKLDVLRALGELVLCNHWLRGLLFYLEHVGAITLPDEKAQKNFKRLYSLGDEYEARVWQVAPPRAILSLLQHFNETGEINKDLKWYLDNVNFDDHGRVSYDNGIKGLEDLEDALRRIAEARNINKKLVAA